MRIFQSECESALAKALEVAINNRQHACTSCHTNCSSTTFVRPRHVPMLTSALCLCPEQIIFSAEQMFTSVLVAQHKLPARTKHVLGNRIRYEACGSASWQTHQASRGPSISANWRRPRYKSYLHPQNMPRLTFRYKNPHFLESAAQGIAQCAVQVLHLRRHKCQRWRTSPSVCPLPSSTVITLLIKYSGRRTRKSTCEPARTA